MAWTSRYQWGCVSLHVGPIELSNYRDHEGLFQHLLPASCTSGCLGLQKRWIAAAIDWHVSFDCLPLRISSSLRAVCTTVPPSCFRVIVSLYCICSLFAVCASPSCQGIGEVDHFGLISFSAYLRVRKSYLVILSWK